MNKVIVTGGLGFIGSHLVDLLLDAGVEVIVIDDKSTNCVDEKFWNNPRCSVITRPIEEVDFENIYNVDVLFHLASILGPVGVIKHAGNIGINTLKDTVKIRDYCLKNRIKMIDISTSEVYGHVGDLREDTEKVFPGQYEVRSEYGAAKMIGEMALVNKARLNPDFRFQIVRPFNVSGPRQKPDGGFVLPRFVIGALTGQPITVYGDGTQRRAFTHVLDIVDSIFTIARSSEEVNQTWNIGNPKNEMTIDRMADIVIDTVNRLYPGRNPSKVYVDPKSLHGNYFAEALDKIPYIRKIQLRLGWEPKYSGEQIVEDVVKFYEDKIRQGYSFKVA